MSKETYYIRFKGKGEHSVNELEKIIEQREEELHLIRSGQKNPISGSITPEPSCELTDEHVHAKATEYFNAKMEASEGFDMQHPWRMHFNAGYKSGFSDKNQIDYCH